MYGLFSRKKKQIRLSPLSGGSGPPNRGQDEVGGGEPSGEPLPTSSRPSFGGHDLQTMEIIEAVSSFEKIRTMLAQILVYRELISVWLIYKSYCGGHEVQVEVVEVILLHIILQYTT